MRWLIHDLFVEQPSGSPHYYWLVSGENQDIPDYIKSLRADVEAIEPISPSAWSNQDYLSGMKVDASLGKCCIFRLYPGGRGADGRSGRWVLLGLEIELIPLDCNDVLQMACFKSYHLESATAALLPTQFPRIKREEPLLVPLTLRDSANVAADQLRGISLSMTSGLGTDGILIIKRSGGSLHGFFRKSQPDRQARKTEKPRAKSRTQPVEPPPITQQPNPGKRSGRGLRLLSMILRNRHIHLSLMALLMFFLGWSTGRKQAVSPIVIDAPRANSDGYIEIDGPEPGASFTVRVRGGREFSFMATDSDSTEFKLHQRSIGRIPPRAIPVEYPSEDVSEPVEGP